MESTLRTEKQTPRTPLDITALTIATCGGVGYVPIVPASWGSLAGVGLYMLAQKAGESFTPWAEGNHLTDALVAQARTSFTLVFLIALFLIGIWAATRVVKITGVKDPKLVVIDEVVGQFITFFFIPGKIGWLTGAAGFLAFRLFDIWKLYPANVFETLPSGLGVMTDDVMAGLYAASFISVLYLISSATL